MAFDNKELLDTHCIIQYDNDRLDYLNYEYLKKCMSLLKSRQSPVSQILDKKRG